MKSKLVQLGLPVAMLGLALGLLVPKQAGATTYYSVNIQLWPGGSSDLTCGWHGGPYVNNDATVQSGLALDWAPSSTISFYVKTLSDGSGFAYAGVAWISSQSQTGCSHVMYASVYDNASTWRAGNYYVHTTNGVGSGASVYINAQQYSRVSTSSAIGSTASESGCGDSWYGYHVHQQIDSGWTIANYPDHTTCNKDYPAPFSNNVSDCWVSNGYYMGYADWSVAYP